MENDDLFCVQCLSLSIADLSPYVDTIYIMKWAALFSCYISLMLKATQSINPFDLKGGYWKLKIALCGCLERNFVEMRSVTNGLRPLFQVTAWSFDLTTAIFVMPISLQDHKFINAVMSFSLFHRELFIQLLMGLTCCTLLWAVILLWICSAWFALHGHLTGG